MKNKKYFFGWSNIRWVIKEFIKTMSSEKCYFSKKRIESYIAFFVGQWGMIYFLTQNIATMTASDIVLWAGVQFAIAGYMVREIQKQKKQENKQEEK